jgi:hypothetical protein
MRLPRWDLVCLDLCADTAVKTSRGVIIWLGIWGGSMGVKGYCMYKLSTRNGLASFLSTNFHK